MNDNSKPENKPVIRVMFSWARSGGTLMNRCLGHIEGAQVYSEITPLSHRKDHSITYQAKEWYGININSMDFQLALKEVTEHAETHQNYIIIRDWTIKNFYAPRDPYVSIEPDHLVMLEELKSLGYDVKAFAFIRNPIDAWISGEQINADAYFKGFRDFIKQLNKYNVPIVKYEEFVRNPIDTFEEICTLLDLPYSDSFKEQASFNKFFGDRTGRAYGKSGFVELPRRLISPAKIFQIHRNRDIKVTNSELGYSASYFGRKLERPRFSHLKRFFQKILGHREKDIRVVEYERIKQEKDSGSR